MRSQPTLPVACSALTESVAQATLPVVRAILSTVRNISSLSRSYDLSLYPHVSACPHSMTILVISKSLHLAEKVFEDVHLVARARTIRASCIKLYMRL